MWHVQEPDPWIKSQGHTDRSKFPFTGEQKYTDRKEESIAGNQFQNTDLHPNDDREPPFKLDDLLA